MEQKSGDDVQQSNSDSAGVLFQWTGRGFIVDYLFIDFDVMKERSPFLTRLSFDSGMNTSAVSERLTFI